MSAKFPYKVSAPTADGNFHLPRVQLPRDWKGNHTPQEPRGTPSDATNKTVTYTSSNTKVATVNSSGKVTAVGGGTAKITAKAGGKTATCNVTVNVPQTGISVSGNSSVSVGIGSTATLKVAKVPSDATDNFTTNWSSANTSIATVSSKGVVTGVALGETTITAKQNSWTVTYKITVTEKRLRAQRKSHQLKKAQQK